MTEVMPHVGFSPAAAYQRLVDAGCVAGCTDTTLMSQYHDDWMSLSCLYDAPGADIHTPHRPGGWGCVNPWGIDDPLSPLPPRPPPPPPPQAPPPAAPTTIIIIAAAAAVGILLFLVVFLRMCRKKPAPQFRGSAPGGGTEVAAGGAKMPGKLPGEGSAGAHA